MAKSTKLHGEVDRRTVAFGLLAVGGAFIVGCSSQSETSNETQSDLPPAAPAIGASATEMRVVRNPGCGCCEKWVEIARNAGFKVAMTEDGDPLAVKRRYGVPEQLASCHTTLVGGYVVEGHVPLDAVQRLLRDRPSIKGIAVPGMPLGSPGMEVAGGTKEPFEVLAFDAAGKVSVFEA